MAKALGLKGRIMKRKYIGFLVLSIVLSVFPISFAAEIGEGGMVLGPGAISCGKFLVDKQREDYEAQYFSWTIGFFSGINHIKGTSIGVGTDMFAMMKHVENYCRDRPLDPFVDAVVDLYQTLARKTQIK